jgi:regulator of replication initiation timing
MSHISESRQEAEEVLKLIGDNVVLRMIERIKKLECENAKLRERLAELIKANGKEKY